MCTKLVVVINHTFIKKKFKLLCLLKTLLEFIIFIIKLNGGYSVFVVVDKGEKRERVEGK